MADNADKLRDYLKKVSAELQASRARVRELEEAAREPIAVVGIGCRYPGGIASAEDLWEVVRGGTDTITDPPLDRGWFPTGDPTATPLGEMKQRTGGYLHDAGDFDAGFFGMGDDAALATDPQQRLLLETSWEALEDAGIDPLSLGGSRTGVFIGAFYRLYAVTAQTGAEPNDDLVAGVAGAVMAGRIAYELGLEGPSATVDTACSASLVALHWACQSLRLGESELALAGGVAVNATPHMYTDFSRSIGLAPDGRCKSFAAAADGSGWSEGVGILALERLSRARAHGHRVLGLIRGSATNRAGASNGLTAPNGQTQQRSVRQALADAGLGMDDVDVIEAHGSGTRLGDSIEAHAMLATYGRSRRAGDPLLLGSIKSNIGHAQSASGVAGVIKMLTAMRHGQVPKTLHFDEPSPDIDWSTGRIEVVTETVPWPERGHPRRSAVSSFGISGTNVHVVLEQAPATEAVARPAPVARTIPWPLAARTAEALPAQAARLLAHLREHPDADPVDVGFSLATTRSAFPFRAVVLGDTRDDLLAGLTALAEGAPSDAVTTGHALPDQELALAFPARTAAFPGFAAVRALRTAFPTYARAFDDTATEADKHLTTSLLDVVAGTNSAPLDDRAADLWHLAHQVALLRLLEAHGLTPDALTGTTPAAAHAAASITLADATLLTAEPGSLADVTFTTPRSALVATPAEWPVTSAPRAALAERGITLVLSTTPGPATDDIPAVTPDATAGSVLGALAEAHCLGLTVNWAAAFEGWDARRVPLPTYAFQRKNYWWVTMPPVLPSARGG